MSEPGDPGFTPTTRDVMWAYEVHGDSVEFDRWLSKVKAVARREGQAEAWADAVASAYLHETEHFTSIRHDPNPYRDQS